LGWCEEKGVTIGDPLALCCKKTTSSSCRRHYRYSRISLAQHLFCPLLLWEAVELKTWGLPTPPAC
jgi:hypothetical protein